MTFPCFPSRFTPSVALLLGLAGSFAGCVDPKSIGLETDDDDGSGSAESGSEGEGSEGSGGTSQGPTTGQTDDGPDTDPTSDTGDVACPPIDVGPCEECTCVEGDWVCEPTCASSCEGLACGTSCLLCSADDPDCENPTTDGVCTADEQCVGVPPPKLGFCEGALQPGFEDELDVVSGCADVRVFARDAADERGLVLYVEQGLYAQAIAAGMPVHVELDATDPSVYLEGRAGFSVTTLECSDVIVQDPDIKEHWTPTAGTVIVDVAPSDDTFALATVQLVGVELHREEPGPAPITVDLTWTDVSVGWFPG